MISAELGGAAGRAALYGRRRLLMLVVLSRAASTSLAGLMSTRRGRDLGMLVGFGVFVLYLAASFGLGLVLSSAGFGDGVSAAATVLGWTPPGALARIPDVWSTTATWAWPRCCC